jgi:hypothetical protein
MPEACPAAIVNVNGNVNVNVNVNSEKMHGHQHRTSRLRRIIRDFPHPVAIVHAAANRPTAPGAKHGHTLAANRLAGSARDLHARRPGRRTTVH